MKFSKLKSSKGAIFLVVIIIATLMIIISMGLSNMILQDMHMIKKLRYSQQALLLAESGINDALAVLLSGGFDKIYNAGNFPLTNLGAGTYDADVTVVGSRFLITSVGTVNGVTRTVSAELVDNFPSSLRNMMSAGNDIRFRAFFLGFVDLNGDIHANNNVRLNARALASIDIDPCPDPSGDCDGDVSASNKVYLQTGAFAMINIAGSVTEGAGFVTFPEFDYALYQSEAAASGDYYGGSHDFGSIGTTTTIVPANGIVYVEDTARIYGTVNIYGGIVADRIRCFGRLNQFQTPHNRNLIISRTNDIEIFYRLDAEYAIVYAGRDFSLLSAGSFVDITGTLIASRNIRVWDFLTFVTYNHRVIIPNGLLISGGSGSPVEIINFPR